MSMYVLLLLLLKCSASFVCDGNMNTNFLRVALQGINDMQANEKKNEQQSVQIHTAHMRSGIVASKRDQKLAEKKIRCPLLR